MISLVTVFSEILKQFSALVHYFDTYSDCCLHLREVRRVLSVNFVNFFFLLLHIPCNLDTDFLGIRKPLVEATAAKAFS